MSIAFTGYAALSVERHITVFTPSPIAAARRDVVFVFLQGILMDCQRHYLDL